MMKAHRSDLDDLRNFVLVEELEVSNVDSQLGRRHSSESVDRRILTDDENVYLAQSEWKTNGKFVIMDRHQAEMEENPVSGWKSLLLYTLGGTHGGNTCYIAVSAPPQIR
jgi:hypothetical protein